MDLKRIVKTAEMLVDQQRTVKALEEELKEAKKAMLQLEREDLPSLMAEAGLQEIKLEDGSRIVIQEDCDAKITDATRAAALEWLLMNGFGGLIKTQVAVSLGRGEHDEAVRIWDDLRTRYDGVEISEDVHHSTLKAFVKEQMRDGKPLPMNLFNVYPYSKAVIK